MPDDFKNGGYSGYGQDVQEILEIQLGVMSLKPSTPQRQCNFNNSDPDRDARCAKWNGLEPVSIQDPSYDKMLCYWPDPSQPNKDLWESAQVGKAEVVDSSHWTSSKNTSDLPVAIQQRLSLNSHLSCKGSEQCCFRGNGGLEVYPNQFYENNSILTKSPVPPFLKSINVTDFLVGLFDDLTDKGEYKNIEMCFRGTNTSRFSDFIMDSLNTLMNATGPMSTKERFISGVQKMSVVITDALEVFSH